MAPSRLPEGAQAPLLQGFLLVPRGPLGGRGALTRSLKSAQAAVPSEGEEGEFGGALRRIIQCLGGRSLRPEMGVLNSPKFEGYPTHTV